MAVKQPKYKMGDTFLFEEKVTVRHREHTVTSSGVVTRIMAESTDTGFKYCYSLSVDFPQAYYEPPRILDSVSETALGISYRLVE